MTISQAETFGRGGEWLGKFDRAGIDTRNPDVFSLAIQAGKQVKLDLTLGVKYLQLLVGERHRQESGAPRWMLLIPIDNLSADISQLTLEDGADRIELCVAEHAVRTVGQRAQRDILSGFFHQHRDERVEQLLAAVIYQRQICQHQVLIGLDQVILIEQQPVTRSLAHAAHGLQRFEIQPRKRHIQLAAQFYQRQLVLEQNGGGFLNCLER